MKNISRIQICFVGLALALLTACGGVDTGLVETSVAETVAAMPPQDAVNVVQVTQVVEVTQVNVIQYSPTPRPTQPPTETQLPTETPTPAPTETLRPPRPGDPTAVITVVPSGEINLTLNQFLNQYRSLTDLQKEEYIKSLPGKLVSWTAEVDNVTTDGLVHLSNLYSSDSVVLVGVPAEEAIALDRKMLVDFTGMIQSISGNFSPDIIVVDAVISRAYSLPTLTPTP